MLVSIFIPCIFFKIKRKEDKKAEKNCLKSYKSRKSAKDSYLCASIRIFVTAIEKYLFVNHSESLIVQ